MSMLFNSPSLYFMEEVNNMCVFNKNSRFIFFIIVSLACSSSAYSAPLAKKVNVPEQIPGSTLINSEGLIKLAQSLAELIVIDSRVTEDRNMGYIENSLSLPDLETNCNTLKKKISILTIPVVFYCNGPECGRSVIATRKAVQCGYTQIYWFRGGFAEWKNKDYPYEAE